MSLSVSRKRSLSFFSAMAQASFASGLFNRIWAQNRNVMPRIVYGCAAPIAAWMFRHDAPVLADHDALGVGVNVDGAADRAGAHRVFVVVEPDQTRLRH